MSNGNESKNQKESFVKRLHGFLTNKFKSKNATDIEKQKKYINSLPDPKDNLDRSFYQYKCQTFIMGGFKKFIYNFLAFPVLIYTLFNALLMSKKYNLGNDKNNDAVIYDEIKDNLIPQSVKNDFDNIITLEKQGKIIDKESRKFFINTLWKRHPFSYYFLLKNLVKMMQYAYCINEYFPKAILTSNEYSFTSSFLTEYCNHFGVDHVDIMHGEKLYSIRDSFFNFNKCYVWDEFYINLFKELKAKESQFIVELPLALNFKDKYNYEKQVDFIYYLQDETALELEKVREVLLKLQEKGYVVSYRPHPIFEDKETKSILANFLREEPKDVNIERSILQTRYVLSKYSTVLYQAYLNEVIPVVDDITNHELFKRLKQMEFIVLGKEHKVLSDFVTLD